MTICTEQLVNLWRKARTRFSDQLHHITPEDLGKTLPPAPNSVGFLVRHIGDVELLFAKNVFGLTGLKVSADTVKAQRDTGEWTDLDALMAYVAHSGEQLEAVIKAQPDSAWDEMITTAEFGTITKAEALGRITSHTAYHAGQLALLKKYGTTQNRLS
jgi:uncharacterized damage-inducible protein DinB